MMELCCSIYLMIDPCSTRSRARQGLDTSQCVAWCPPRLSQAERGCGHSSDRPWCLYTYLDNPTIRLRIPRGEDFEYSKNCESLMTGPSINSPVLTIRSRHMSQRKTFLQQSHRTNYRTNAAGHAGRRILPDSGRRPLSYMVFALAAPYE